MDGDARTEAGAPRPRRTARWVVALLVVVAISAWSLQRYAPPLPTPLVLDLTLDAAPTNRSDPLIVSGRTQAGDFLFVRVLEAGKIVFGYEPWGEPSQLADPIPLPGDGKLRLEVELPALTEIRGVLAPRSENLRLRANGTDVFNRRVNFHVRLPREIYFGENPIGGTACGASLHGRLQLRDGAELRGEPRPLLTWSHRLRAWLLVSRWQAISALLAGALTFLLWPRAQALTARWRSRPVTDATRGVPIASLAGAVLRAARVHRTFLVTTALGTISFSWMVSYGSFRLIAPEQFSNFYEFQAVSLLHGRLDVPGEAISDEAFVYGGRTYGYFGPTPALLRLPFVIFGAPFGELARAFMVAYFVALLVGLNALLRTMYRAFGHDAPAPPAWSTVALVGGAGLGSTVYYLGARAYIYHEAILCGVTLAVLAAWCALRHVEAPTRRWWLGALACGVLSVHARPPVGFFALTLLGAVALLHLITTWRTEPRSARRSVAIGVLAVAGVFSFNLLSYLKFRTFEGCPLRYNVQYDAKRLARIDGKQFHLVNLPIAIDSYFVHANFRLEPNFPFFFLGSRTPAREWVHTKIDYHDKTLGFPYAMPALFGLATLGVVAAWRRFPSRRPLILTLAAAGIPMSLAMFTAIAITHRYTADFCPYLFTLAAVGAVAVTAGERAGYFRWARTLVLVGTGVAVVLTFIITLHHQRREVWGVPAAVSAEYIALQKRIDAALRRP